MIKVNCGVKTISFSAHSDYKVGGRWDPNFRHPLSHAELQPEHVILVHGEASKMDELAVGLKKDLAERYNRGLVDVVVFST